MNSRRRLPRSITAGSRTFPLDSARPDGEDEEATRMSPEENKRLIRRYIEATDQNESSDWSILDEYIAEEFVAHNPPVPGVSLDREGMKRAAEIFQVATPGQHEITMQSPKTMLSSAGSWGRAFTPGSCSGSRPRTKRSRRTGSQYIASATARSSNTGRSSTSRASSSRSACCPDRPPNDEPESSSSQ